MNLLSDLKKFIKTGLNYEGAYILRGEPGTGKSTFCLTAVSEWSKKSKKVILTTNLTEQEIREKLNKYGRANNLKIITMNTSENKNLTMISHEISEELNRMKKGDLFVIDSISSFLLTNEPKQVAKFLQTQVARTRAKEATLLITIEEGMNEKEVIDLISYFTDAIFELKIENEKRLFRIYSCKFDTNKLTWEEYRITDKGFQFKKE